MKKLFLLSFMIFAVVSCQSKIEGTTKYASEEERFRHNIAVKGMGDDYVVYEYVDVRIDDVATLASKYCYEMTENKKAYLRDIYLYKNHKRRATFDCVDLAQE